MRNHNPIENTGILIRLSDNAFLGSCFVFRYPEIALTAAHCIGDEDLTNLGVVYPNSRAGERVFQVQGIDVHPTADAAVLKIIPPDEREITWAIYDAWDDRAFGLDVFAFGYPQEWVAGAPQPMPRLFKGHVQRFFDHESYLGFSYLAVELSFACPAGLSGSAIVNPTLQGRLYGLVTENVRTSTEVESVLEVDERGDKYKESFHRIVSYGVALWLPSITNWLDAVVPPLSHEEVTRRGTNQHAWAKDERAT